MQMYGKQIIVAKRKEKIETSHHFQDFLSNDPDEKERTKRHEQVGMQNGANFTVVVSTTLLIGSNIKIFYDIFAKSHIY